MGCYNVTNANRIWRTKFNMTGTSSSSQLNNGKMDADTSNVYAAYDIVTPGPIYILILNRADGSFVGSLQVRNSTKSLMVGSVYATGSSVVYFGSYSSSEAYAELIKYNASSSGYTIYEQTGLNLRFQFLDTAQNDCWYALVDTQYIHLSQLSTMSEVTGLTVVEQTSSAFETVTTLNSTNNTGSITVDSGSFVTTTTNVASSFSVNVTLDPPVTTTTNSTTNSTTSNNTTTTTPNNNTNSDDDSISTLAIVLINIGAVILIVIAITVVLCIIKCRKKSRNTRSELSIVETPADESNALKEENKI